MTISQLYDYCQDRDLVPIWADADWWSPITVHAVNGTFTTSKALDYFSALHNIELEMQGNSGGVDVDIYATWLRDEQVPEFTVYLDSQMIGYVRDEPQLRLISKTLETVAQSVMRDLQ